MGDNRAYLLSGCWTISLVVRVRRVLGLMALMEVEKDLDRPSNLRASLIMWMSCY